ncbi:MAG: threonine synthase [Bacteroidota bacterium]|nr:threonine synthase [Bacteroidota bacterium]MDP4216138.1 threonine synthase [Bacteroidota bacterium]MDP4246422.1 threonine synthase [Bacteroidota bacterium]MDP4253554.1 threonine synthase [Bacteroidota bacterium]MDP4258574.1 threonine synthase [Bacteroidota bacterium]
MQYYSLHNASVTASFRTATIQGQAPDKGLYFPESIPAFPDDLIRHIDRYSREEIAFSVIRPYVGEDIPETELQRIIGETIHFDFPLVPVTDTISVLELFHGPTLAFKDVGARFMSRCLGHFVRDGVVAAGRGVTVLVATSGDTGGAVANGFYDVDGVNVVILYPSGKVSSVQELQLTTLGKNISALEVSGSFDDCQRMVKQAFADPELNRRLFLTSANSINVARWLPQQFYYLFAYQQWPEKDRPPVISVPSGNFGNICAGLLAHRSGLPVRHFIAACNANNVVPSYLQTGRYQARTAIPTLSNAMDVGDPSNFVRILELFHKEFDALTNVLTSYSISDEETRATIRELLANHHYLADPHGAVGYLALARYLDEQGSAGGEQLKGICLETAHPVKFYDVVEPITGEKIPLPESVQSLIGRKKQSTRVEADYSQLKDFLLG